MSSLYLPTYSFGDFVMSQFVDLPLECVRLPIMLPIVFNSLGTVGDPKIKTLDNVARIIPKAECLPQMLTCGTVVLDVGYDREELRIALDYLKR